MKSLKKLLTDEQGIVLVISLLLLVLLMGAGLGAIVSTQSDLQTSSNVRTSGEAFFNSEAGLHHGWQELSDDDDNDGRRDFINIALPTVITSPFARGTYAATLTLVPDVLPKQIQVESAGTAPNSALKIIRARFKQVFVPPDPALITNGNLAVSGNIEIMGTCGGAHSNADLELQNSAAQLTGGFTSSGAMTISGTPCIGSETCDDPSPDPQYVLDSDEERRAYAETHDEQLKKFLPAINPADFARRVGALPANGYILHDNGVVTTGPDVVCDLVGLCTGGTPLLKPPAGWTFGDGRWRVSGSKAASGVFYAETAVVIGGSPGSSSDPWRATIIARDSIEWGGTPNVQPFNPPSDVTLRDILMVTGNDLMIAGDIGLEGHGGAVLVHQQIGFSGNPEIHGYIFGGNGIPTWSGDPFPTSTSGTNLFDVHTVSGNPKIFYNCGEANCANPTACLERVQMVAGSWAERLE